MFYYRIDENIKFSLPDIHRADEIAVLVRANLERLRPWMPWAIDEYSAENAKEFIHRTLKEFAENGRFNVMIEVDGRLAGSLGFHDLDTVNQSAAIGYWIGEEFEGRGIVSRCCRVLIDYLFDTMKLNRVQINCNFENIRSRAIPERLGFKLEGIHRQVEFHNGKYGDWAVYAMLNNEWKTLER